jgi:hypothetical protein
MRRGMAIATVLATYGPLRFHRLYNIYHCNLIVFFPRPIHGYSYDAVVA